MFGYRGELFSIDSGYANEVFAVPVNKMYEGNLYEVYDNCLSTITQKQDYTQSDFVFFRANANRIANITMSISGRRFATNYWHLIVSGHIEFFMKQYGNLYRYSNEGCESISFKCQTEVVLKKTKSLCV